MVASFLAAMMSSLSSIFNSECWEGPGVAARVLQTAAACTQALPLSSPMTCTSTTCYGRPS